MIVKGDSVGAKRLHQLMESSKENNFKIGPNLWAGLTQVLSGNSIALVGTPDQIAERIVEFVELGFDKVLLRGFPHLETIEQLGELVIPKVREKLAQKQFV
jgi:alkanesulfonate monooxygenase